MQSIQLKSKTGKKNEEGRNTLDDWCYMIMRVSWVKGINGGRFSRLEIVQARVALCVGVNCLLECGSGRNKMAVSMSARGCM
jgi:hypothetical protein